MKRIIVEKLVILQQNRVFYPFAHMLLDFLAVEIPKDVILGEKVRFVHCSPDTVIHPKVIIEDNV